MKLKRFNSLSICFTLALTATLYTPVYAQNGTSYSALQKAQCAKLFLNSPTKASSQDIEHHKIKVFQDLRQTEELIYQNQKRDFVFFDSLHRSLSEALSILYSKDMIGFIVGKESYNIKNNYFRRQSEKENFFEHPLLSFNDNSVDAPIRIPYFEFSLLFDLNQQLDKALKTNDLQKAESVYQILNASKVLKNTQRNFYFFNKELGSIHVHH